MKLTTRMKAHFVISICHILPMYQASLIKWSQYFCGTKVSLVTEFQDDKIVQPRNHKIKDDHKSWQVFYDDILILIRFWHYWPIGNGITGGFPRKGAMMRSFGVFFIISLRRG